MQAVLRLRGQNRPAYLAKGYCLVDKARGEVNKLVDKTIPSQRKKDGRPRGKNRKYAGLLPRSTSSRLQENVVLGNLLEKIHSPENH